MTIDEAVAQQESSNQISWVIKLDPQESIERVSKELGAVSYKPLPIGSLKDYYQLTFDNSVLKANDISLSIKSHQSIRWSAYDPIIPKVKKNLNDPLLSDQWHLNDTADDIDVDAFEAWALGYSGAGVQVCIVDDGLDHSHPDISPNYYPALSWDYNGNDADPTPTGNDAHGTACGGVAAGHGDNSVGISGAAYGANLSGIRLIAGGVTNSTEATALTLRMDSNYIYSNSWGPSDDGRYYDRNEFLHLAFIDAVENGRDGLGNIYVWAAGNGRSANDNVNYDSYASSIYTIAVGAHGDNGVVSWYSEPGASMLISAPSNGGQRGITTSDIVGNSGYSDYPGDNDYTDSFGGTSSACPLAAGVIALMLEANPMLTWRDVQHILVENAVQIESTNGDWTTNGAGYKINHNYGFGSLDAAALVTAAASWQPVPDQVSDTSTILNVNEAIVDAGASNTKTINISLTDVTQLEHVELLLDITHGRASDLEIVLTSPLGTQSILAEQRNLANQSFGSRAFMTVRNWGELPEGDWTITITDKRSNQAGTWNTARLILHGNERCSTPFITEQSSNTYIPLGTDTFLYVVTDMSLPQEYQWQKDLVDIPGADGDTLYITDFSASDIGDYRVSVTDLCRTKYSVDIAVNVTCEPVEVVIAPDDYGAEITWSITDTETGMIIASGGPYPNDDTDTIRTDVCLLYGCYDFTINDSFGDGICCNEGNGAYIIAYQDTMILSPSGGNYGSQETVPFCLCDNDVDQDGTLDCDDDCPLDPNKTDPGICGCGLSEEDLPDPDLDINDDNIATGTYSSEMTVDMQGRIRKDNHVLVKFGQSASLLPEFEVEEDASLTIQKGGCSE